MSEQMPEPSDEQLYEVCKDYRPDIVNFSEAKAVAKAQRELIEKEDGRVICRCCGTENVMPHYKFSEEMEKRVREKEGWRKVPSGAPSEKEISAYRAGIEAYRHWLMEGG